MTLKIRYIEIPGTDTPLYKMQIKKWWGWKIASKHCMAGFGDTIEIVYSNISKESLLNEVLLEKYNTELKYVDIIEYPTLKMY
jgi:hypothetical protein